MRRNNKECRKTAVEMLYIYEEGAGREEEGEPERESKETERKREENERDLAVPNSVTDSINLLVVIIFVFKE